MSAIIRSIRTNISKNKDIANFSRTITSNFINSSPKSHFKDFLLTKTSGFSDNDLTNTLASSIRSISQNKQRNKEKRLFWNLNDFHRQFILNKNNEMNTISKIYIRNNYNKNVSQYLSKITNHKNNLSKLTKKTFRESIFSPLKEPLSRNSNYKGFQTYSNELSSFFNNNKKYKDKSLNERNNFIKANRNNNNSEECINNNHLILSTKLFKKNETVKSLKQKSYNKKNNYCNRINSIKNKNKYLNNDNLKDSNRFKDTLLIKKENNKTNLFNQKSSMRKRLNEELAYSSFYNLFNFNKRNENKHQFLYKTRFIILDKYIRNLNKTNYFKQLTINENIMESQILQNRQLGLTKKLFYNYNKTMDEYYSFLNKNYKNMKEENEILKETKTNYIKEIEKMKQKVKKYMGKIKEAIYIKYFLLCVKNHTMIMDKFTEEEREEIENDKKKLKQEYYLDNQKEIIRSNDRRTSKLVLNNSPRKLYLSSSGKNLKTYNSINKSLKSVKRSKKHLKSCIPIKKVKKNLIINSADELFEHFEMIATNLNNLLKKSNDLVSNNIYLKKQLDKVNIYNNSLAMNYYIHLDNQIILLEQKLEIIKRKNILLLNQYNELKDNKFQNDIKMKLVQKHLYKIYNNIKKKYKISSINSEELVIFGDKLYLEKIEAFLCEIIAKISKNKNKYPLKYDIIKQQLDKRDRKKAFLNFQNLLTQKILIKIDKVLKKASKTIYKRYRKTNDYIGYYKHFCKTQETENMKKDKEKFLHFLDIIE